jgi:uncharacterized Zn finger protein (UPF0148 family)
MRHIACQNDECANSGAPYFDFEDDGVIVLCPHCGTTMTKIPTPDLAPAEPEGDA